MATRIVTRQSPSRYQDCHWLGVQRHPADHSRGRSWIRLLLDQPRTDGIYSESPQAGSVWSFSTTWLWPSLDGDLRLGNHPGRQVLLRASAVDVPRSRAARSSFSLEQLAATRDPSLLLLCNAFRQKLASTKGTNLYMKHK